MFACIAGNVGVAKALLIAGADTELRDTEYDFQAADFAEKETVNFFGDSVTKSPEVCGVLRKLLRSDIMYWHPMRHLRHIRGLQSAVEAMLQVHARNNARDVSESHTNTSHANINHTDANINDADGLPQLPVELWMFIAKFLRSSDFMCKEHTKSHKDGGCSECGGYYCSCRPQRSPLTW